MAGVLSRGLGGLSVAGPRQGSEPLTDSVGWVPPVAVFPIALALVLVAAMLRVVPENERLVICRLGGVCAVRGPGPVLVLPGMDRWVRVSLCLDPLDVWLEAATRDGVMLRLKAVALVSVVDPARYAMQAASPLAATGIIVESHVRRYIAERDLTQLSGLIADGDALAADVDDATGEWGVAVSLIQIVQADVPLHSLHRWATGAVPGRRAQEGRDLSP